MSAPRSSAALTAPNMSANVRAGRTEPHDSLDDFPTPPWATRALLHKLAHYHPLKRQTVWEPACNRGFMARPLAEKFGRVIATDLHDYGWPGMTGQLDFTLGFPDDYGPPDWVITNPPFKSAETFAEVALRRATFGVALLCRSSWWHGIKRQKRLLTPRPPTFFMPFAERLNIVKGAVVPDASKPIDYAWFVWIIDAQARRDLGDLVARTLCTVTPIGKCRTRLERPGDYDAE
jgi:hypothetical protein